MCRYGGGSAVRANKVPAVSDVAIQVLSGHGDSWGRARGLGGRSSSGRVLSPLGS